MFVYQKNFFNPTLPVDEAQFWALVRATKWNEAIDQFRETGDQKLKRGLPAFIFQATFDETPSKAGKMGAWRKQSATRLTGLVVMDVDHVEDPREVFESWGLAPMSSRLSEAPLPSSRLSEAHGEISGDSSTTLGMTKESLGMTEGALDMTSRILLIYITPSGHGLKIVFKADVKKGNLIDNQHAMAKVLGVEVDESCKDASRMSFICKESDILFIDKELFTYENKEFSEKYEPEYRANHSGATKAVAVAAKNAQQRAGNERTVDVSSSRLSEAHGEISGDLSTTLEVTEGALGMTLKWRGYDLQGIIDARYGDKLPCKEDSNRHAESLKLATDLMLMLDGDKAAVQRVVEAQPWVQEIIEERNENVEQTVESAAGCIAEKEKKYAGSLPSKAMLEAVKSFCGISYQEIVKGVKDTGSQGDHDITESDIDRYLWDWGEQIKALMDDFPLLKDICKGLKKNQYPAALFVAGGFMMTLMTRCTYRFYHRPEELRRLNNSTLIIGDPACGKSFATRLYKLLAAPIMAADQKGKDAINAYREEMRTKGANKEKPKKPKVVIRVHPARTSNAQFIQDMVNAVEIVDGEPMHLHMLTFDTELDNTVTVQKGGSWIDKQSLELKAFHNEEDGQAYSNNDSIFQEFNVYWNFVYTGTPIALKKKVNEQNFGSGMATRLTCVPLPSTDYEMLERESKVDFESDKRIKLWATKLDRMKGLLPMDKIVDKLYDWTARRMMDAKENDSKADEMLLKRCAYHGLNFSAPFIVMRHWDQVHQDGDYWTGSFETDEVDWQLVELIVNMHYACQRHFFGAMAETYFDNRHRDAVMNRQHHQKTMECYNRLPSVFTMEDVRRCFGYDNDNSVYSKISRLKEDRLAEKIKNGNDKGKFRKMNLMVN
ncbi:VirE N-terminal domain-containing protein [Prevotella sp. ne3005]|uniref:BT4734/BF3469 family protein n=1 Tax=Prevotella sp. ne3005 TaxID=1761887 RepID=UPI0008B5BE2E|nr:BT4734/BF3469 family protein [Prevotella sp. ne3005]SEN37892.1 VirE N-terminal domain-containing protein [Prevotella sp. ne3005]